jgi:hypothetical protein
MKKTDFGCEIRKVKNGFIMTFYDHEMIESNSFLVEETITEKEGDEFYAIEELLWWVAEFFGFYGSKHDEERIGVCRELQSGEIKYRGEVYVSTSMADEDEAKEKP